MTTNPNPLYPKLLDILRVSLVEFGDKATPELQGRTFIDGIFLYHGTNKSGAKIIAILTPEGIRIPIPLPAIAKLSIIGRSPTGDLIEDLGIRVEAPFRLVNFYGMNPDTKPPPNQPPYIPPKDAYAIVSDVNKAENTVAFEFPETDIEPIRISVADGLADDVPFLFLENLETLDIGGEDQADEGIEEVIELEEEGAYGTITVQNYVQVAEEEKIYGDDFQENDMLNDILSNEIEREPERAEQLVRTLASLKKNLRIPSKRFQKIRAVNDAVHPTLRNRGAEIPNWIVPVLRNRRRLQDIDPAVDEMVAEGDIDGTYDSVTTAGEMEEIREEVGTAGSRSAEMAAVYGTRGNAQEPNFGGTDGRTRHVILGAETGELVNVAAAGEKDNDNAVLVQKTRAKIALRGLPEGGKRGLTVGGAIVYPPKSIPQRIGSATDLQNLVEWGAETPVGQSNRDRFNPETVEAGEMESYLENRIRNSRELEIGDQVRVCLAPVYANRREGLVFRGVVERVVGGGADGERGTIYVRPTGAIDVGLSGDAVLEIPVADAEIVRIRDLTNVHCETAKGVRPLYLQAGRGRLADIDVARLVAPNLRQILQTQDAYSLRATGVTDVLGKLQAHAIDPRGLTHQELAEVGAVAKANIAAYIELLGEIRKMVAGRAEEGVRGGDTPSEMLARLPPADMYSVLKRLDTMADRQDFLRRQLDGGAYIWLRECLRDLGERRLVLEALTKDIMSNREEIGVRLAEIRENKKRMSEAARSGMIEGLNLVKSYTSMKSLNKDSLSRNDILIDKNFDDTNRGLWMMIREDNPDIKDRDQLLKILRAFLRDMYPDEVGPDGSIPEARISDHIRGGKKVKDGDHALLIRDLTTRVFVQEGGRWVEVSGEFGGVNSVVPKSVSNLTDFVRNGVHIKETEGVLSAEHERLRRMENDLELHQITATVLAQQATNFDKANAEMDDAAARARRMNVFAPDLKEAKWVGQRTTAVDKVTVVELDDEETFVDQEDFDAPMRVAFSDQDVSDLANRLGLDYGDALPGEEMEKATVDLATMTPRQIFWFEMQAKIGNFTGVHLSRDGVVEYLEIVSVMEALKPSTQRTAKDAKTRVRSAQFDVMIACAAVLLAGQIHQDSTRVDVGTLNAFPLRSDRGDDMGAVQVFATKMSLAKEQLEGLRGNSGIMLKNAHQLAFRPDTIQSGILTLIRSLLGGNSLFQMRLRESEARLIRKEGGLGVAGEGEDFGVAKDDTKNALPPLNVEAKVSAPVKGKSGTPPRSRVGQLMKVYESIALNVKNQEPILVTRTGVPYEENGFQMKSGADVGMLELKNLNASVVEELRELDGEFKKSSNSVIDAHGGRRPLVLSELTTNELSTEKIANYFVETLGNPLLSREDNLKLLRRSGVEPNEKSLWAILDRGAKVQARREEGDDAKSGVDVARWALLSDAEEAFGTQGRVIDGDVGERLELCVNNRVVDDVVFGTFLYILGRSEWQTNRGSRSREVPVRPPQSMVELAEPHANLLGRIQENLERIYAADLPVIADVDVRGEFFGLVHSRLGKQVDARRSSRVEGLGSITISFIQDLLGATDGEGEDEVRIVNLDVVEFLYTTLKLALGVTPIDGFDLLEGVVRATESLEELEVRIRKEREDERNLFIQRIHQLEGNEAREVDKIMKDLRLGRWAVRGKVGYDPEQVAREMIEAEAFGRDLQEGLGVRAQMREDAERNEFVAQTGDDIED